MSKKILMLLNAPYPNDIRVKKEADALLKSGFRVFLLCLRRSNEKETEVVEQLEVHRIDAGKNKIQLTLWDSMMSFTFNHSRFYKAALSLIQKEKIDCLHVHDLPLAGTGIRLKKSTGIKLIVDFHENYPEALKTWFSWQKNPVTRIKNKLIFSPAKWLKYEKKACVEADVIVAVVDEMKKRIMDEHAIPFEKITVITNTESTDFAFTKIIPTVYDAFKNKFIVTYSGGIGPHRGIDTAIQGMALLKDYPTVEFVIVGSGSTSSVGYLKKLAIDLDLKNVHFLGSMPFNQMFSFMSLANVNVIPHISNGHTDNTIPHKLFQGMMAGKPLLVSSSAPLKRYVDLTTSGLTFEAGNAESFANRVIELYKNPDLCDKLGENGKKATLHNNLNWENTATELVRLYTNI